jgi:type IV secretory pathway TraG/TraD family ATPase VirD4
MIYLGRDVASRTWLWGSPENAYLLLAPPRRGKGVSVIIPNILDWPGPLVATSTKDDLIVHTACALREERPVYVFDPSGFSEWAEPVGWDPVAGCEDPQVAIYRARALNGASGSSQGIQHADYFQSYNEAIHRCYLHAAAISGRDIAAVRQWVNKAEGHDAIRSLRESPVAPEWADDLEAIINMHHEALTNVFSGARRAYDSLADPRVLRACQPGAGAGFNVDRIIAERAALFIVGTSGAQANMAPIITALIETIVNEAKQRAARSQTRRLAPPLGLFLDECANIAPLPSLPQLVTDGAGQGITTMMVLQSLGQARARWGADGTAALWDGCTVKVVLGGLADTRDLETISRMCGDVDVEVHGRSYDAAGQQTRTFSQQRLPAFTSGQVRTLRRWHGLLFYEELRPIETALPGWWDLARCSNRVEQAVNSFASSRVSGAPC